MGNWNRRYQPRKKFRHYEYEDPPLSPPRPHDTRSYSSGVNNSGVPSWEIDYCHSVRVPWRKVLASKKYIYCHPSVLNWDDSAGKEALQNAKERYWALINGLSCGNPLPDPDVYIDEIDWNPYMDPDLMVDLDLQVFDPDNAQKIDKLEAIDEEAACAEVENDENPSACDNPWERNHVQGAGSSKIYTQQTGGCKTKRPIKEILGVGVMGTPMLKDQGTQIIVDIPMEIIILWVQKREVGGTRGMNLGFSKTTGTNLGFGGIPDTKIMSQSIGIHKDLSRVEVLSWYWPEEGRFSAAHIKIQELQISWR
ncbi:UNVERIFIED_CONTAM: hypothetical protein Sangu_0048400 [Sesamum angustifolium]|uniref:Uncharacterized protein n=1 Tax=Sesamum angustifolium TaxID=2727405 RepID=A0AAW2RJW8_9LAMI